MKAVSILLWLLLPLVSWGQVPKVVMLTSLMDTQLLSRKINIRLESELEKRFRKHFKTSAAQIKVQHLTTPKVLWQTLNDPTVVALYWVSHAKQGTAVSESVMNPGSVRDAFGNDVKMLFKRTTKNLKFLSLIGCQAESILDEFKSSGVYDSLLTVFSFPKKVDAIKGLTTALKESPEPSSHLESLEDEMPSYTLQFRRSDSEPASQTILVEASKEVIGIISGNEKDASLTISQGLWDNLGSKNLKLTALKDTNGAEKVASYEIELNSVKHLWKAFGKNGIPAGSGQNLYLWQVAQ